MCNQERVAARGGWGTVEWALDERGRTPARSYFDSLERKDQIKVVALFQRLAETGRILNREKFRSLGGGRRTKYGHLWEFKSFQIRFLGDFRKGKRFLVAHGLQKQSDEHSESDLERAVRILEQNDVLEAQAGG